MKVTSSSILEVNPTGATAPIDVKVPKGFGELVEDKILLSREETLFLVEEKGFKARLNGKEISFGKLLQYYKEYKPKIALSYLVYRDLRARGYVPKDGMKYGCDFRVYDKGVVPKRGARDEREHALYLVEVVEPHSSFEMKDLIAKARVANTVKKRFLLAIATNEGIVYLQLMRILL